MASLFGLRALSRPEFPPVVLAVAVLLVYGQTIFYGFVWDDEFFVLRNPALRSWSYVPAYFTDVGTYAQGIWAPMYRPLRNLSYLLDYKIAGFHASWFHAHNVLLHALNAILAYLALEHLLRLSRPAAANPRLGAFFGALVWALHPVQTESVAWIKSRDELLFCAFYLTAFYLLCRGFEGRWLSPARQAAIVVLFVLALLSKEMAITFPLISLLAWRSFGAANVVPRRIVVLSGSMLAIDAVFVAVRHLVIGRTSQTGYLSGNIYHEVLTTTSAFGRYLRLALVPTDLVADYQGYAIVRSPLEPRFLIAGGAILVTLLLAAALRRRAPLITFGILWFWITLLPVSNVVPTMQFLAERFLYLPLLGFAAVLAGGVTLLVPFLEQGGHRMDADPGRTHPRLTRLAVAALVTYVAALAVATSVRLPDWRSNATLFARTIRDWPQSARVRLNYAATLVDAGRYEEALRLVRKAESPHRDGPLLRRVLGVSLLMTGKAEQGSTHLKEALRMKPDDPATLAALGFYYGSRGNHATARDYFERAVQLNPADSSLKQNYARAVEMAREAGEGATEPQSADRQTTGGH